MQINTIDSFLEKYINGYLFTDLATIKDSVPKDMHPGNAAYLMTGALCSGIEFLGYLLQEQKVQDGPEAEGGSFAFEHYCKYYLARIEKRYEAFGVIGRELIRNGIAHSFATKGKIGITRRGDRDESHLVRYGSSGIVVINPDFLYEDLKQSYEQYALPLLSTGGKLRERAENNYEGLKGRYNTEIERTMQQAHKKIDSLPWLLKEVPSHPYTLEEIEANGFLPVVS